MNVVAYTQEICVFYPDEKEGKNTIFKFFNQIRLYHRFHLHIRGLMMNKVCRIFSWIFVRILCKANGITFRLQHCWRWKFRRYIRMYKRRCTHVATVWVCTPFAHFQRLSGIFSVNYIVSKKRTF